MALFRAALCGLCALLVGACSVDDRRVDPDRSTVTVSGGMATVGDQVVITVVVVSRTGRLAGRTVTLSVSGSGNSLTQPAAATGRSGQVTATLSSTVAETKEIRATVLEDGVELPLTATAVVVFVGPPPKITRFYPTTQNVGGEVIIEGTNLDGVTGVTLGGGPAATIAASSTTMLRVVVPAGSRSGAIQASAASGSTSVPGFILVAACSGFSLMRAPDVGTGAQIQSATIADLNGDGKPDLIGSSALPSSVWVWLGDGTGSFGPGAMYGLATGSGGSPIRVADLNADSKPDLVAVGNSGVSVLMGNGDGTFQPAVGVAAGNAVHTLEVADLNGDARPDLVVAGGLPSQPGFLSVLFGDGAGGFANPANIVVGEHADAIALGHLDRDSFIDVVLKDGAGLSVVRGLGAGAFAPAALITSSRGQFVLGEMSGDDAFDLVVASGDRIALLLGNQDGSFQPAQETTTRAEVVALADFDGDNALDVASAAAAFVTVRLGTGTGMLQAPGNPVTVMPALSAIAVGDFQSDGHPDLALCNGGAVAVLLTRCN